ncbi:MAG: hypothetical protein ABH951_00395, partial [Patescibacteria group bacterium]
MKHCKDCEPSQVNHFLTYMSVFIEWINQPFFNLIDFLFKNTTEKISKKITIPFFKLMVFLKLGYFSDKPNEKNLWRVRCLWEEAEKRGIKMKEFHFGPIKDLFIAEFKEKKIIFESLPRPDGKEAKSLKWMDNKGIMKKKFKKIGIPVANGDVAWNRLQAIKIFNKIKKPVITKPNIGSRSRHTLIHINIKKDLIIGFKKAKKLSPLVIVEEELEGYLFRGALIDGKLVGLAQRDQPQIIGDGILTIRELLEKENSRPERNGLIFQKIIIDKRAETELANQKLNLESISPKEKIVYFSQKTG